MDQPLAAYLVPVKVLHGLQVRALSAVLIVASDDADVDDDGDEE
jgi:hypothetical protein